MIQGIIAILVLDLKRAWQDRARLIAGLVQPLLYLFVLGAGIGASTRLGGGDYRRFIFPGTMALTMLFTASFSAISIVFDRQIGFFKAILVAPVPRSAIAVGKIIAGAVQALAQGLVLLPVAPLAGVPLDLVSTVSMIGAMTLASITFSTIGVAFACRFNSTTVFPIVSNAVLLPMFFLSGGLYPLSSAPQWMQIACHADPVAYTVDLMRGAVLGRYFFPVWLSLCVLTATIALLTWAAVRVFNRGEDDSALGASNFRWKR
jgi:ABC-2 type transport system permease protein